MYHLMPPASPLRPMRVSNVALLVIDVQMDFCPGGALAVPDGDRVVPVLNTLLRLATSQGTPVYASRDWHPPRSRHFQPEGRWPIHCVVDSPGARFHPDLGLPSDVTIVSKGVAPDADGYSAFDGHLADGTALADELHRRQIDHLVVAGLATDYCVKHSVLDARSLSWRVAVATDAIAPVELAPGDGARALEEMKTAGATLRPSEDIVW
jgi:nicotinamidase/pyrazinamidase